MPGDRICSGVQLPVSGVRIGPVATWSHLPRLTRIQDKLSRILPHTRRVALIWLANSRKNPKFEDWMHAPQAWKDLIGGNLLWQIERKCRQVLRLRMKLPFDLQRCARKMYHMHDAAKAAAANKAAAEANAEQKQGGTTTTSANKAGPRQGVYTSTGPGRPPIDYTSMGRKTTPYKEFTTEHEWRNWYRVSNLVGTLPDWYKELWHTKSQAKVDPNKHWKVFKLDWQN